MVQIFVSHSTADVALAKAIVAMLVAAFGLDASDIRCTSLPGFRIDPGASVSERIREEVRGCDLFIGVLTHQSVGSAYVLFEMGARWGNGGSTVPIVVAGVGLAQVPAPLREVALLDAGEAKDVEAWLGKAAKDLSRPLRPRPEYEPHVTALVEFARRVPKGSPPSAAPRVTDSSRDVDREVYRRLRTMLPSSGGAIAFLREFNFAGFSFEDAVLNDLRSFYYNSLEDPAFEFFDPELEQLRKTLHRAADELLELMATETFPAREVRRQTVPSEWEIEQPDRFWRVAKALGAAANQVCGAYDELVRSSRRKLESAD